MKVVVLGNGVEGQSAARYYKKLGEEVTVRDTKDGPDYLEGLGEFDAIVRSPGIKPSDIIKANRGLDIHRITSVTNEFMATCPAKIIGVTGTKGKGTTATLIAKILEADGKTVHLGGNIGKPPLDFLPDVNAADWVVLELSSFQLMDAKRSPHIAVMLMIAPDHQEWHPDIHEYLTAKQNIFAHQGPGDRAIYNACNLYSMESGLGAPGDQVGYNDSDGVWVDGDQVKMGDIVICSVSEIALPGRHNWDNVCAAIAATWPIVQSSKPVKKALKEFAGMEHRLEKVAVVNDVTYINDSYSSSTGPTLAAINAYSQPKLLILGGFDKGQNYDVIATQLQFANVRHVIVIGAVTDEIVRSLKKVHFDNYTLGAANMDAIVQAAAREAHPGDVVILSPGTSSFDMFENFKERGEHFKQAVKTLAISEEATA